MSKHTPGPWTTEPSADNEGRIAIVSDDDTRWYIAETCPHIEGDPDEANAALLAAAPAMLEALREASAALAAWGDLETNRDNTPEEDALLAAERRINAAIAVATGESK